MDTADCSDGQLPTSGGCPSDIAWGDIFVGVDFVPRILFCLCSTGTGRSRRFLGSQDNRRKIRDYEFPSRLRNK